MTALVLLTLSQGCVPASEEADKPADTSPDDSGDTGHTADSDDSGAGDSGDNGGGDNGGGDTAEELVPGCGSGGLGDVYIHNESGVDVELREYWCSAGGGIYEPFGQGIEAGRTLRVELNAETWFFLVAASDGACAQSPGVALAARGEAEWSVKLLDGSYTDVSGVCR